MRTAPALLAAALALALAGCGAQAGEGEGPATAAQAYTVALNGYFAEEEPATDAYEAAAEGAADLEEFAEILAAGLEGSERRLASFQAAARPPAEVRDLHAELIATVEEELRLGEEYVAAGRAGDETRIEALDAELEPVLQRFPRLQERFDNAGYDVELPEP